MMMMMKIKEGGAKKTDRCRYLQVEALGVLSGVRVRARSHWSSSSSSSSSVGPPSAARQPMRRQVVTERRRPTLCDHLLTSDVHLPGDLHGGGQVPHLDAAVAVAAEQVPARPRADAAGALALVDHEGCDGRPVHRAHLAHPNAQERSVNLSAQRSISPAHRRSPLPVGRQPDVELIRVRDDSLDEDLLVVSLSVRTWKHRHP